MAKRSAAKPEEIELPAQDLPPPTEPIEIELAEEDHGPTQVDLSALPTVTWTEAPVPAPEPEAPVAEEDNPLQKALDAQKRADELQRSNADLQRQLREREEQIARERDRGDDGEYNAVLTAIANEQLVIEKAEADYAGYSYAGDWANAAKAQRLMASAASRLDRLEDGKQNFDSKREAAKTAPATPQSAPLDFDQKINSMPVPESAKSWLRSHPEFINDAALNEKLGNSHRYLVGNRSIEPFTPGYFDALDIEFGFKKPEAAPEPQQQPTQRRSMPVSAPVSRDVPTASGVRQPSNSVTLTAEERLIARNSFSSPTMTDAQKEYLYAQNKQKLKKMRANGEYRLTTEQNG